MKTAELTGAALDWAVCEATGMFKAYTQFRSGKGFLKVYGVARNKHLHPSTDPSQAHPIIEREGINTVRLKDGLWEAWVDTGMNDDYWQGPTPLISAMRCYVASKLGDEVDVPEELT